MWASTINNSGKDIPSVKFAPLNAEPPIVEHNGKIAADILVL